MLNEDEKYICVDKEREIALYYSKDLGKRRIYRQSYPLKPYIFNGKDINKGLILFKYKRKQNAQKLCNDINKSTGQNFQAIIEKGEITMLSEEEKKAIEYLKYMKNRLDFNKIGYVYAKEDIETVLNLITKLQKDNQILKRAFDKQTADMSNNLLELQQKDKQIDLMAEVMFKSNKAQLLIEYGIENKELIIKEFEKLVKEKGE